MIVYLARDFPAFVMYCVYGESCSSLLIESTDSMIGMLGAKYGIAQHMRNPWIALCKSWIRTLCGQSMDLRVHVHLNFLFFILLFFFFLIRARAWLA